MYYFNISNLIFNISNWINGQLFLQYVQTDPPTNKSLAALVIQLLQFQEDSLGKNVSKPPMTRIPVRRFITLEKQEFIITIILWLNILDHN